MNVNDLKKFLDLMTSFSDDKPDDKTLIGDYVIVRCRDAGVHAGVLVSRSGRECVLQQSRRLWKWRVAGENDFLSGLAVDGLHKDDCRVSVAVDTTILTENCEIMLCSSVAERSISEYKSS